MFFSRGKNKIGKSYVFKDIYEYYIKGIEKDSPYDIDYTTFVNILSEFFKESSHRIIVEKGILKMPYRLGSIYIDKKKVNSRGILTVDFNLTNKIGKVVKHLNEHSYGYKYFFKWERYTSNVLNRSKYRFIPSRQNKRDLAKLIKADYDL